MKIPFFQSLVVFVVVVVTVVVVGGGWLVKEGLSVKLQKNSVPKGQLNSEWIYEVIVSPKIPTKNYRDFCPGSLLHDRAKISAIFGWDFGRNNDLINSFWT